MYYSTGCRLFRWIKNEWADSFIASKIPTIDGGDISSGLVALLAVRAKLKHRKTIGDAIRETRKAAGISQEKLAEKAELHHNFIGEVERGEKTISVDSLMRIASALKCSISTFFPGL